MRDLKSLIPVFLIALLICGFSLASVTQFSLAQSNILTALSSDSNSWHMFHNDLSHSGYSESAGPLTNQTLWKYQAGSGIESSPAVVDGAVYFGVLWNGHNGFVNALNATTGSKIWQFATDSGVESSPAVVDGVVYIGSYGGYVYALDAATGSRIWSFNTGGSVFPSPAVVDGRVYVGSASGDMYALDAAEGLPLWKYRTGGAIFSSPAVVDGVVYVGSQDNNMYAFRADVGSVIWKYTTGNFVDTSPAVVGGIVYFGSRDGYVYALDAADGSQIWSFSPSNGNYESYYYSTPAVANGVVYVGGYDSYISALNATNGNVLWEFPTGGYIFSSPVVTGEVVYVGSFDGNVYALDATTGSKIWSYQTGDQMRSSAAVANGVVYVGSGDGYLYAFGSPSGQPALYKISGYILNSNGYGLAGAEIIFNVPDIVPSVYSDSSGYYEIFAPAGTYRVTVWPPFDSNYIYYDEQGFVVESDTTKNIVLASGYKVSGYITDASGNPIVKAVVALDKYLCGWYSTYSGYYFVTAPAGTYTLSAKPASGPYAPHDVSDFSPYHEDNVVVNGNLAKNITVSGSSTTPTPNPAPEQSPLPTPAPNQPLPSYSDDFSADTGAWQYLGSAYRDPTNEYLVLTTSSSDQTGVAFFKTPIQGSFTANFRFLCGGTKNDGLVMFFYKQQYPPNLDYVASYGANGVAGGRTGFNSQSIIPGYGIEFDGWANIAYEFADIVGGQPNPPEDPNDNHIALIKDFTGDHLAWVDGQGIASNVWHQVSVQVKESSVAVFVDQELVLQWNGTLDRTYDGFGFSGSNGQVLCNTHIIDDFSITANNLQKPSLTVSCRSSTSYSGFNVQIDGYLTLDGNGVSDAPILLSYSATEGKVWEDLTLVYTGSDGGYSATWLPSVTGNYLLKATYEGDVEKLGASSEIVNLAVTNFAEEGVLFAVSSNSTVTSLAFNSTTSVLSFTVSGPSETTGYVKVTIAKSLISNPENIKIYLDGNQLNYEVTSNADSWLLSFTYTHSTHQVSVDLAVNTIETKFLGMEYWTWIVVGTITVVISVSLFYFKKRKQ